MVDSTSISRNGGRAKNRKEGTQVTRGLAKCHKNADWHLKGRTSVHLFTELFRNGPHSVPIIEMATTGDLILLK